MSAASNILWVDICEAKSNPLFTEEQRAAVRFLRYSKPIACAHCGKKKRTMWTMLCAFRSIEMSNRFSIDSKRDGKAFAPLTPVCADHPLAPDFPEESKKELVGA